MEMEVVILGVILEIKELKRRVTNLIKSSLVIALDVLSIKVGSQLTESLLCCAY